MNTLREIPRHATHLGLALARMPLTATEALLGRRGDKTWPPALAFDRAGGMVKTAVGTVVSDPALVREGRLDDAAVEQLERAETLEAAAELRREAARDEVEERRTKAAERRRQAARQQQQRKRAIAAEEKAKERDAAEQARRREAAAEQAEEAAAKAVARKAQRGRRAAVAKEEAALRAEQGAQAASQQATVLDQAVQAQKAERTAER